MRCSTKGLEPRVYYETVRVQRLSWHSPTQQCQKSSDVMGQSGQALGDGPEASQTQGIHGQAAERGQDANAIALSVAVRDFLELGSRHAAR